MLDEPWKRLLAVLTPLVLIGLYFCWQCVVLVGVIATGALVALTLVSMLVFWIIEGHL